MCHAECTMHSWQCANQRLQAPGEQQPVLPMLKPRSGWCLGVPLPDGQVGPQEGVVAKAELHVLLLVHNVGVEQGQLLCST